MEGLQPSYDGPLSGPTRLETGYASTDRDIGGDRARRPWGNGQGAIAPGHFLFRGVSRDELDAERALALEGG